MMKNSNIKSNYIYNIFYQILLIITPLITSPYVSRILGTTGIGMYSYTYSLSSCFAMVGLLGVNNYGNRSIASVQDDKEKRSVVFWNIFYVQAIFSIVMIVIYLIYTSLFVSNEYRTAMFIQTLTVVCSLFDINWYFFGVEKFKLTVTRNSIIKILNVALILLLVKNKTDVNLYIAIIASSLCISNVVIWPFLKNEVNFVEPDFKEMLKHVKPLLILFIPVIAITLYNKMDKVMIGMFSTVDEVGLYENTEKIISIPKGLITALGTVMLPRMTNLYSNGESNSAIQYIDKTMDFTCFSAFAMSFGIAAISNEFAPWFFGKGFEGVSTLLIGIAPTIVFISWANVIRTQYLIPLKKDNIYIISVWIGAIVNLIFNTLLIPSLGALGAVIGTVLAELSVATYQTYSVRKELKIKKYIVNGLAYLIIGVLMFVLVRFVSNIDVNAFITILIEIAVGGIFYLILATPIFLNRNNIILIKR